MTDTDSDELPVSLNRRLFMRATGGLGLAGLTGFTGQVGAQGGHEIALEAVKRDNGCLGVISAAVLNWGTATG